MKIWSVVMAVALLAICAAAVSASSAYPTWEGATGVVMLPTAVVAPYQTMNLAVDYQKPATDVTIWPVRINGGIAENTELWLGYEPVDLNPGNEHQWDAGIKYAFATQAKQNVDAAIGGSFGQFSNSGRLDTTKIFLALSKDFAMSESMPGKIRGTVGVLYNKLKEGSMDDNFTRPYVAVEYIGDKAWNLGVEYRWKDDTFDNKAPLSAVLRYNLPDCPVWVEVGTTNAAFMGFGADDQKMFVGVGYAFTAGGGK